MSNLIIPRNVSDSSDRSRGIFNQMSTKLVKRQFLETLFQRIMTKSVETFSYFYHLSNNILFKYKE